MTTDTFNFSSSCEESSCSCSSSDKTISQDMNMLNEVQYIYIGLHIWKMHQSIMRQIIDTVNRFYDNIISCSSDVPEAHKQYIQYQIHRPFKDMLHRKYTRVDFLFPYLQCQNLKFLNQLTLNQKQKKTSLLVGLEMWTRTTYKCCKNSSKTQAFPKMQALWNE